MDAEPVGDDLLEYGLVALALAVGAGKHRDAAGFVEAHFGAFGAGRRRALDGVGEADAAQPAALARFLAPLVEALEIGKLHGKIHVPFEFAAVIGEREAGLERHLRWR